MTDVREIGYYVGVSVPFRGLCSEISKCSEEEIAGFVEFPSPFGVCVLKCGHIVNANLWR